MAKTPQTTQNQNRSSTPSSQLHSVVKVAAVVLLVLAMVLLGLYQGFVDQSHQPLGWRQVLTSNFWQLVMSRSWTQQPTFYQCGAEPETQVSYQDAGQFSLTCDQGCYFSLPTELAAQYRWPSSIPVITRQHSQLDPGVTQVQLLAADLESHRLVYQTLGDNPRLQFVEVPEQGYPHLWQEVDLTPNAKDVIEFVMVARSQQGHDYALLVNQSRRESYLYGLDTLWLRKRSWPNDLLDLSPTSNKVLLCGMG